jgi:hypothetical protein
MAGGKESISVRAVGKTHSCVIPAEAGIQELPAKAGGSPDPGSSPRDSALPVRQEILNVGQAFSLPELTMNHWRLYSALPVSLSFLFF